MNIDDIENLNQLNESRCDLESKREDIKILRNEQDEQEDFEDLSVSKIKKQVFTTFEKMKMDDENYVNGVEESMYHSEQRRDIISSAIKMKTKKIRNVYKIRNKIHKRFNQGLKVQNGGVQYVPRKKKISPVNLPYLIPSDNFFHHDNHEGSTVNDNELSETGQEAMYGDSISSCSKTSEVQRPKDYVINIDKERRFHSKRYSYVKRSNECLINYDSDTDFLQTVTNVEVVLKNGGELILLRNYTSKKIDNKEPESCRFTVMNHLKDRISILPNYLIGSCNICNHRRNSLLQESHHHFKRFVR